MSVESFRKRWVFCFALFWAFCFVYSDDDQTQNLVHAGQIACPPRHIASPLTALTWHLEGGVWVINYSVLQILSLCNQQGLA